ncbi:MAG TPA: SpoIIIAH-like family protein [Clostridiaceae bacterium]|nr:SpoIIIAH-like family protein [Clostridiaceae bacterium]
MMVYKRKQIIVLSLVLMIIVAGYLQYSYRKSSTSTAGNEGGRLGEAVYVDESDLEEGLTEAKNEDKKEKKDEKKDDKKAMEEIEASQQANDFFYQAKIEKDVARSQGMEALAEITGDSNAPQETISKAHEMMMNMVALAEKEAKIELLVKDLGFSDVVALFGEDGTLDIIVKAPSLSSTEVAQIADIASRQAGIEISKIVVSSKY